MGLYPGGGALKWDFTVPSFTLAVIYKLNSNLRYEEVLEQHSVTFPFSSFSFVVLNYLFCDTAGSSLTEYLQTWSCDMRRNHALSCLLIHHEMPFNRSFEATVKGGTY